MAKTAPLCQFNLPNGRTCRQIALKDEQVCRHHMRLFRHESLDISRQDAAERQIDQLRQMDLYNLLATLYHDLGQIRRTMPRWHEARITLEFVLKELKRQAPAFIQHVDQQYPQHNVGEFNVDNEPEGDDLDSDLDDDLDRDLSMDELRQFFESRGINLARPPAR